jgi:hypothetical protein
MRNDLSGSWNDGLSGRKMMMEIITGRVVREVHG